MLKSQWDSFYWSAFSPDWESPGKRINAAAFNKEQYPALSKLDDLHYLEVLMLAYTIIFFDRDDDGWEGEPITGEVLFEPFQPLGNVELGIQVLTLKGWLTGPVDESWMGQHYEANLKKIVEDGLLTTCNSPAVSEQEILPIEFRPLGHFNESSPFSNHWKYLCSRLYWYARQGYDWVVLENLKPLCRFFMDLWQLDYGELRVLAVICYSGSEPFTEEAVIGNFPDKQEVDYPAARGFQQLVDRGFLSCTGIDEDGAYLFHRIFRVENDLEQYRLHYLEADQSYSLQRSAMDRSGWEILLGECCRVLEGEVPGGVDDLECRHLQALPYLKEMSVLQLAILSLLITCESMTDKDGLKFISFEEVLGGVDVDAEAQGAPDAFRTLSGTDHCWDVLEFFEGKRWITLLTSTSGGEQYIKVRLDRLAEDGLLSR